MNIERFDVWMSKRSLPVRVIYDSLRIFFLEHCPVRATALSYTSLLAIVPLLILLTSISLSLGMGDLFIKHLQNYLPELLENAISYVDKLLTSFFPDNNIELNSMTGIILENIMPYLNQAMGIRLDSLGLVGALALLFTFFLAINTIEINMNIVWGINKTRSYLQKIMIFIPFLFLFAGGIGIISVFLRYTQNMLNTAPLSLLGIVLFGLWLLYCYMPYASEQEGFWKAAVTKTKKRWLSALISAVFTFAAILAFILAMGFLQAFMFARWSILYGSLAVFPMIMFLFFGFWNIVLFGNALCWRITERKCHQKYILERIMQKQQNKIE
ncbi:MAG: YihY/virulence factor BrkB family protein [Fibromonadales bacterium]|nr:YihY/virulence factor BrkB family protein [Fibromonadales bacterium]